MVARRSLPQHRRGVYEGVDGVMRVIEQLAGVGLPASLWESQILPARVRDYSSEMLDELLATGAVIWSGQKNWVKMTAGGTASTGICCRIVHSRRSGSGESFGAATSDSRCSG